MNLELKLFDKDAHYTEFCRWMRARGGNPPDKTALPRIGAVAVADEVESAVQWLYMDNSCGMAMLAWLTTNPDAPLKARYWGAVHTTRFLIAEAAKFGYGCAMALARNGAGRLFAKEGFSFNHNVGQFFRRIDV